MTQIFSVNENNDIFLDGNNHLAISRGQQAVLEQVEHAVKTLRGEMPFAADRGLPNFETIWSGSPNLLQFEFYWRQAVNRIADVVRIERFSARIVNNELIYEATIVTTFGTESVSGGL